MQRSRPARLQHAGWQASPQRTFHKTKRAQANLLLQLLPYKKRHGTTTHPPPSHVHAPPVQARPLLAKLRRSHLQPRTLPRLRQVRLTGTVGINGHGQTSWPTRGNTASWGTPHPALWLPLLERKGFPPGGYPGEMCTTAPKRTYSPRVQPPPQNRATPGRSYDNLATLDVLPDVALH